MALTFAILQGEKSLSGYLCYEDECPEHGYKHENTGDSSLLSFRSIKPNIEAFLHGLETTFMYGRLAECKIDRRQENEILISLHHDLGLNWSKIVSLFLLEIRRATFGQEPKFELTKSSIVAFVKLETEM